MSLTRRVAVGEFSHPTQGDFYTPTCLEGQNLILDMSN